MIYDMKKKNKKLNAKIDEEEIISFKENYYLKKANKLFKFKKIVSSNRLIILLVVIILLFSLIILYISIKNKNTSNNKSKLFYYNQTINSTFKERNELKNKNGAQINKTYNKGINKFENKNESQVNNTYNKGTKRLNNNPSDYYISMNEKVQAFIKAKKFFELCMKELLINNDTIENCYDPKISIVIPVYNKQDKIKKVVRSIQNQNFTDIEIILVNDNSNDKTILKIEEMQKEDPRIILINNTRNMGTLYSRCIGTLKAKGKYIFPLDNDDLIFDEDILDFFYNEAERDNYDIIEFKGAEHTNYIINPTVIKDSEYCKHKHGLVLHQPQLGLFPRKRDYKYGVYDVFLWGKIIKNDIYKKTINLMGKEIYSKTIIWGEDLITSFVLFRIAQSFKFISRYGIFRYKNRATASSNTPKQTYFLSIIIYLKIILNFTDNTFDDKKYVVNEAINYLKIFRSSYLIEENRNYLKNVIESIINCTKISNADKIKIIDICTNNLNYILKNTTINISAIKTKMYKSTIKKNETNNLTKQYLK